MTPHDFGSGPAEPDDQKLALLFGLIPLPSISSPADPIHDQANTAAAQVATLTYLQTN